MGLVRPGIQGRVILSGSPLVPEDHLICAVGILVGLYHSSNVIDG